MNYVPYQTGDYFFMKQFAPRGRKLQFIMVWKTQFPLFVEFVPFLLRTCVTTLWEMRLRSISNRTVVPTIVTNVRFEDRSSYYSDVMNLLGINGGSEHRYSWSGSLPRHI